MYCEMDMTQWLEHAEVEKSVHVRLSVHLFRRIG
jgi:hypothetical protein